MRISTNQLYINQTNAMMNDQATVNNLASDLSSGISLNEPSDDPLQIAQDLNLKNQVAQQNADGTLAQIASNQLSTADGSLSTLTDILQKANSLAVEGASDVVSPSELNDMGNQVNQLLQEAIGVANTQSNGVYLFGGSSSTQNGPVTAIGNPPTSVQITGNNQVLNQNFPGGQTLALSTSLQQAFNVGAPDGSPSVFDALISLRDALTGDSISVQSNNSINHPGTVIGNATTLNAATLNTPLTADSSGNYAVAINGPSGNATVTLTPAMTIAQVVAAINASGTGVTAAYNTTTEKMSLTSTTGSFNLADAPSAGATNSGNFLEAFGLPTTATSTTDISGKIADVNNALQVALAARSAIGVNIQALSDVQAQTSQVATSDTASLSAIEDTNVQQAATQFSLAQTALQAAYLSTSKLESSNLFNYISTSG